MLSISLCFIKNKFLSTGKESVYRDSVFPSQENSRRRFRSRNHVLLTLFLDFFTERNFCHFFRVQPNWTDNFVALCQRSQLASSWRFYFLFSHQFQLLAKPVDIILRREQDRLNTNQKLRFYPSKYEICSMSKRNLLTSKQNFEFRMMKIKWGRLCCRCMWEILGIPIFIRLLFKVIFCYLPFSGKIITKIFFSYWNL